MVLSPFVRTAMSTPVSRKNRERGSVAEFPLIIFSLFMVFAFPMINLGTTALRHTLYLHCCRKAASVAATAYSFSAGTTAKPAACVSGPATVTSMASKYPGITVQSTDVKIVSIQIDTGVVTTYTSKLPAPANTGKNLYFIELTSIATIAPMTTVQLPCFVNIPGLCTSWTSKVSLREFVESPQGLDD